MGMRTVSSFMFDEAAGVSAAPLRRLLAFVEALRSALGGQGVELFEVWVI